MLTLVFVNFFPDELNERNYMTETTIAAAHIRETFHDVGWVCDKQIEGGCA